MATILQTDILEFFTPIFVFLLIFVVLYAFLQKTAILGKNKGFDAIAAFAVAILFLFMPEGTIFITNFTPWIIVFSLLVVVIFSFFMFLGVSSGTIENAAKDSTFITVSIIVILIIFFIALSKALGPFLLTNTDPGFWNATKRAWFHPRMLGAVTLLGISAFAIKFIAGSVGKK